MTGPMRGDWVALALPSLPACAEGYGSCWPPSYPMQCPPWPMMPPAPYAPPAPYMPPITFMPPAAYLAAPPRTAPVAPRIPTAPVAPLMPRASEEPQKQPELRGPTVHELRAASSDDTVKKQASKGRFRVGFWNVTGRDVRLTVDGQERMLPRDRAITLDLPRSFAWQIDQRRARNELIPDGQATFEVVIRP